MIFDAIFSFVISILTGVLGLIPEFSLDLGGFGNGAGSALAGMNSVFPATTLAACIAFMIGLRLFIALVAFIAWVWDKVPFQ